MTTLIDSAGRVRFAADKTVMQGLLMSYEKEMGVKVVCTSPISPASGTLISWSAALYDTGGFVAAFPSTNIVIPQAGWYSVIASIRMGDTGHTSQINIRCNGVDLDGDRGSFLYASGTIHGLNVMVSWYYFNKGDVITVFWDTNGNSSVSNLTTGETGVSCAVWREA